MLKGFEGNIESSSGKNLEKLGNMEAERPFNGIEQPFNDSSIQDILNRYVDSHFESERPIADLPGESVQIEEIRDNKLGKFSNKFENNAIENQGDSRDGKDVEKKKDGLTEEEKKELKERTGWPDEIIDCIGSMEEAEIYEKAGLQVVQIDGKWCLIRNDIDMYQVDEDGISNRERMERGHPPITKDGKEVELHHIGQKQDSPLAELTMEQHRGVGNDTILHDKTKESEIDRTAFAKERRDHWKSRADS